MFCVCAWPSIKCEIHLRSRPEQFKAKLVDFLDPNRLGARSFLGQPQGHHNKSYPFNRARGRRKGWNVGQRISFKRKANSLFIILVASLSSGSQKPELLHWNEWLKGDVQWVVRFLFVSQNTQWLCLFKENVFAINLRGQPFPLGDFRQGREVNSFFILLRSSEMSLGILLDCILFSVGKAGAVVVIRFVSSTGHRTTRSTSTCVNKGDWFE